jgi:SAM-dependent methyltransferase
VPASTIGGDLAPSRDEREARELFAGRYGRQDSEASRDLERLVIGSDFGANGYTTLAQADLLAGRLELAAGKRLLDVGSGRGWPGLYLAKTTGCAVVLTDLPEEAMRGAARRSSWEGLSARAHMVVASARRLPFGMASFDGIVHTDVLC